MCVGGRVFGRDPGDVLADGQGRGDVPAVVLGARAGRPATHDHQGPRHVLHAGRSRLLLQATQVVHTQIQKTSLQTRV